MHAAVKVRSLQEIRAFSMAHIACTLPAGNTYDLCGFCIAAAQCPKTMSPHYDPHLFVARDRSFCAHLQDSVVGLSFLSHHPRLSVRLHRLARPECGVHYHRARCRGSPFGSESRRCSVETGNCYLQAGVAAADSSAIARSMKVTYGRWAEGWSSWAQRSLSALRSAVGWRASRSRVSAVSVIARRRGRTLKQSALQQSSTAARSASWP